MNAILKKCMGLLKHKMINKWPAVLSDEVPSRFLTYGIPPAAISKKNIDYRSQKILASYHSPRTTAPF